jgi:hypothetical protein
MSQEDIKAAVVKKALTLCEDRIKNSPNIAVPGVLESIHAQLEWLVSFFEGRNNERAKLHKLVFGHYAIRELDERDEEFIEALKKANYVAHQTGAGLKIDLREVGYES